MNSKILLSFSIILVLISGALYMIGAEQSTKVSSGEPNLIDTGLGETVKSTAPKEHAYEEPYTIANGIGDSMNQYGFYDGDQHKVYTNRVCKPGDFCSFTCLVERCIGKYGETEGRGEWFKRLEFVQNDCYWFEGNPERWTTDGVLFESFDSRLYGCLLSHEFIMNGVVEPII